MVRTDHLPVCALGNVVLGCLPRTRSSGYHTRHVQKRPFVKAAVRLEWDLALATLEACAGFERPITVTPMKAILPFILIITATACSSIPSAQSPPVPSGFSISDRQVIESDGTYNSTPAVAQAANGDWVLSYKKGLDHVDSPLVILRRSQDYGQTWSPEVVYFDTSQPDPTLALTPDGRLLIEFVKLDPNGVAGSAYSLSQDNGLTWGAFTFFDNPVSNTYAFPTAFLTVAGTMYAASYGPHGDCTDDSTLWDSVDSGTSWIKGSVIRQAADAGINETAIAEVGATNFLAISRDDLNTNTWAHFSDDSGVTWGNQIDYTSQVGVLQLPQLIQAGNALLLFGRQFDPTAFPNQFVAFASFDGGMTFTDRTVLDTYTGESIDGGYCWPLLMGDGNVFVVYYGDSHNLRQPDIKSLTVQFGPKN